MYEKHLGGVSFFNEKCYVTTCWFSNAEYIRCI